MILDKFFLKYKEGVKLTPSPRKTTLKKLSLIRVKPIDAQELQDPEKVLSIWVKNLNDIVNKISSTKSLMFNMKPKDAIKKDIIKLDNLKHILKKNCYLKILYTNINISLVNSMEAKKDELMTLSGVKIHIC